MPEREKGLRGDLETMDIITYVELQSFLDSQVHDFAEREYFLEAPEISRNPP